jgi:serine O-acetyltransferase
MVPDESQDVLHRTIAALSTSADDALTKAAGEGLPDRYRVAEWVQRCKRLLLTQRDRSALRSEIPALAERLADLLRDVTLPGGVESQSVLERFIERLPRIRARLAEDVEAAFDGDPAAKSFAEIVVSYPSIRAIAIYRIAHELYGLGVPILPRMMTEHAHDLTGIDIHPGARIGRRLFIDHGTGVVIGETCEIGTHVKLYQGVTLGALSFPTDSDGQVIRGMKRHPTIEDRVVVYANATILGGRTVIGCDSVIGSSVWITKTVSPNTTVTLEKPQLRVRGGASDAEVLGHDLNFQI